MISSRARKRCAVALVPALAACFGLAACGSTDGATTSEATGDCGNVAKREPGGTADLSSLPTAIRDGYNGYFTEVNSSVYAKFAAKQGPFKIGYSDSFSANGWRANALAQLKSDVAAYKDKGITSELVATNSNLDNNLQIQQITSMINQGVDAIIAIPNSPTAFNKVIKQAYDKGIPFITLASHVTSPYAINVDGNYRLTGAMVAAGLAEIIGGKGDVLVVDGINGAPASSALAAGYKDGFANCPEIKPVGNLEGQWSEATAKTVSLQYLSTHPGQLAGVVNSGGMTSGILQALEQTGREALPVGDANPDKDSLVALQKDLADKYVASIIPPEQSMHAALYVALATLQGQGPKFDTIVAAPPIVSGKDTLDDWVQPGWASLAEPAPAPPNVDFFAPDEMGAFFMSPKRLPAVN